jgi:hypothetical protein
MPCAALVGFACALGVFLTASTHQWLPGTNSFENSRNATTPLFETPLNVHADQTTFE